MDTVSGPEPTAASRKTAWAIGLAKRAARLVLLGIVLTLFYAWVTPKFYPSQGVPGFAHGMLHGGIMPMALPALVAGRDVTIYAEKNTGRTYKLGYTIGINLCGLIVFGTAFWTPRRP